MNKQNQAVDDVLALLESRGFEPEMAALICAGALRCLSDNYDVAKHTLDLIEQSFEDLELGTEQE